MKKTCNETNETSISRSRRTSILIQDFVTLSLIKMRHVNIQLDLIFAISSGKLPITGTLELSRYKQKASTRS
ncbi:hypothetical protein PUN28_003256 [Cardiocondyla obscurior]|uniref:Uncharacterized protein n=1 Tax=Cardiocondyla obscurior TaxID=286306 RepID=A0AAW2GK00_9HYME